MTNSRPLGRIVSLWRYPVKSMMGEELNSADITERGIVGDRAYALRDSSDGKIASAKNPRKWGKLFDCRASLLETEKSIVRITLPSGQMITTDEGSVDEILSTVFGRAVQLAAAPSEPPVIEEYWPDIEGLPHNEVVTNESIALGAPAGTFFDYAVLHILTTTTLDKLRSLYPEGRFETRRFRPNLVLELDGNEKSFVENAWVGKDLLLGDEVRVRVSDPCPRCVMTTLPQGDLPHDPGILRTAAQHNKVIGGEASGPEGVYAAAVGVYARVTQNGSVRRGDEVRFV